MASSNEGMSMSEPSNWRARCTLRKTSWGNNAPLKNSCKTNKMCKFYTTTYYQKNMGFLFSHDLTYNTCTFDTWWIFFLDQDIYLAQLKNIQPGKIVHVVLVLKEEICPIFLQILLYSTKRAVTHLFFFFEKYVEVQVDSVACSILM